MVWKKKFKRIHIKSPEWLLKGGRRPKRDRNRKKRLGGFREERRVNVEEFNDGYAPV